MFSAGSERTDDAAKEVQRQMTPEPWPSYSQPDRLNASHSPLHSTAIVPRATT